MNDEPDNETIRKAVKVTMPTLSEISEATSYKGGGIPPNFMANVAELYQIGDGWHPSEIAIGIILGLQIAERRQGESMMPHHQFVWGADDGGCDRTVEGRACGKPRHVHPK